MNLIISELFFKETILQRNYREMTISWSFAYNSFVKFYGKNKCFYKINVFTKQLLGKWSFPNNSFVKFHGKNKWGPSYGCVLSKSVIMMYVVRDYIIMIHPLFYVILA